MMLLLIIFFIVITKKRIYQYHQGRLSFSMQMSTEKNNFHHVDTKAAETAFGLFLSPLIHSFDLGK